MASSLFCMSNVKQHLFDIYFVDYFNSSIRYLDLIVVSHYLFYLLVSHAHMFIFIINISIDAF